MKDILLNLVGEAFWIALAAIAGALTIEWLGTGAGARIFAISNVLSVYLFPDAIDLIEQHLLTRLLAWFEGGSDGKS